MSSFSWRWINRTCFGLIGAQCTCMLAHCQTSSRRTGYTFANRRGTGFSIRSVAATTNGRDFIGPRIIIGGNGAYISPALSSRRTRFGLPWPPHLANGQTLWIDGNGYTPRQKGCFTGKGTCGSDAGRTRRVGAVSRPSTFPRKPYGRKNYRRIFSGRLFTTPTHSSTSLKAWVLVSHLPPTPPRRLSTNGTDYARAVRSSMDGFLMRLLSWE